MKKLKIFQCPNNNKFKESSIENEKKKKLKSVSTARTTNPKTSIFKLQKPIITKIQISSTKPKTNFPKATQMNNNINTFFSNPESSSKRKTI
jgi:hypothetical protein